MIQTDAEYIIFTDGDCVPSSNFVKSHRVYSERHYFLAGNRILLSESFTNEVIKNKVLLNNFCFTDWVAHYLRGNVNRLFPLMVLRGGRVRKFCARRWKGVMTSNFSLWREDFEKVNGLDELYQGWGLEDSDLAVRLINAGIFHKTLRFTSPVFHLWHKERSRSGFGKNLKRLRETIKTKRVKSQLGLEQYSRSF